MRSLGQAFLGQGAKGIRRGVQLSSECVTMLGSTSAKRVAQEGIARAAHNLAERARPSRQAGAAHSRSNGPSGLVDSDAQFTRRPRFTDATLGEWTAGLRWRRKQLDLMGAGEQLGDGPQKPVLLREPDPELQLCGRDRQVGVCEQPAQ